MSETLAITIDGAKVAARPGQTIMEAAEDAGIYIPRLCFMKDLAPFGSCRVCTVVANGRNCSACTEPVAPYMVVENETATLNELRRILVELLLVEGNHFCMFCEKSGNCELQATAYRLGIHAPRFQAHYPRRPIDASHPDILIDRNRCIQCGRCVTASRDLDGKNVFQFVERAGKKMIAVNADARLVDTDVDVTDKAITVCPVGTLIRKHEGFKMPIGSRRFDGTCIGSDIEDRRSAGER